MEESARRCIQDTDVPKYLGMLHGRRSVAYCHVLYDALRHYLRNDRHSLASLHLHNHDGSTCSVWNPKWLRHFTHTKILRYDRLELFSDCELFRAPNLYHWGTFVWDLLRLGCKITCKVQCLANNLAMFRMVPPKWCPLLHRSLQRLRLEGDAFAFAVRKGTEAYPTSAPSDVNLRDRSDFWLRLVRCYLRWVQLLDR